MRKEYGKALREIFTAEMKARLPRFAPVKVTSTFIWPGERAFRWVPAEPFHFWVLLRPDFKGREAFTVEVGWSKLGRFPELPMRPSPADPSPTREEFGNDEYMCRLGAFFSRGDFWWEVERFDIPDSPEAYMAFLEAKAKPVSGQEASRIVRPHVEDALEKLRLYGVPYLEELRGVC